MFSPTVAGTINCWSISIPLTVLKLRHMELECRFPSSESQLSCEDMRADLYSHLVKIVSKHESALSKDLMSKDREDERSFGYWTPSVSFIPEGRGPHQTLLTTSDVMSTWLLVLKLTYRSG